MMMRILMNYVVFCYTEDKVRTMGTMKPKFTVRCVYKLLFSSTMTNPIDILGRRNGISSMMK